MILVFQLFEDHSQDEIVTHFKKRQVNIKLEENRKRFEDTRFENSSEDRSEEVVDHKPRNIEAS